MRTKSASASQVHVVGLKIDYLDRPLGLGNPQPRLSWRLESNERNVLQGAYRILVASSKELLEAGRGDLWDSGKIHSRNSIRIQYQGRELASRQRCWWSVEIWDQNDNSARSSESDWWEMGLLDPKDWSAQWLAVEDRVAKADRETGLRWIWGEGASPERPTHRFRFSFELPEASSGGALIVAVRQSFWWSQITRIWLDGVAIAGPGRWIAGPPAPFDAPPGTTIANLTSQHLALQALRRGRHVLAVEVGTRSISSWGHATPDTPPNTPLLAALVRFELNNGKTIRLTSGPQWKTHSEEHADEQWFRPDFDDSQWAKAAPNAAELHQPWPAQPAMHLRRGFTSEKKIAKARLYVTALGVYEARLNGMKVGDAVLAPGPAQYDRGVPYQVYDVASLIHAGANVLGLTVADGWYAGFEGRFAFAAPPRRLIVQLELTYEDGSQQIIATGPGWRIADSAVRASQIKFGEVQDLRFDPVGWDRPQFDDAHWEQAGFAERPSARLIAQSTPPIRIKRKIRPRSISQTAQGEWVIDFGVCFGGWCELQVTGKAGARIELKYSERIGPSGEVDQSRLYDDPVGDPRGDVFFLKGDPAGERLGSRFVYRGFRYVQVSGVESALDADAIEGVFIHSDLEETGTIRSDSEVIQGTFHLALQSQRSDFVGVAVDNNTREVRGYLAEMGIFGEAAVYLMDVSTFFAHHVDLTVAGQAQDGTFPLYAPCPQYTNLFPRAPGCEPGCEQGVIFVVWQCWRHYGDTAIVARNWEAMNRSLQFVLDHNPNYLWLNKRGFDFGDWLSLEATPKDLMATAFWAHAAALLAQMAEAIGKTHDAMRLTALRACIQAAFNAAFVKADGTIGNGSQTSYALPLAFNLLPKERCAMAVDRLAEAIRNRSPRGLTTGTWGTRFVLDALADGGQGELAYELLMSTDFPSWGYMLRRGATAMWESWDEKHGNLNQPALGSVAGFLFRRVAGIHAATPGFETIVIRPKLNTRSMRGGGDYHSVMGRISTDWAQRADGSFTLDLTLPANTTANVHLPARRNSRVEESGQELTYRRDMRIVSRCDQEAIVEVGSGCYRFAVTG